MRASRSTSRTTRLAVLVVTALSLGLIGAPPPPAGASAGRASQSEPDEPWVTRTVLRTPGNLGRPWLLDINDHGQIVGHDDEFSTPLLWRQGEVAELLPSALPDENGIAAGRATFINDRGQVVIEREGNDDPDSLLWQDGSITRLPSSHPAVFDLNESGQVLLSTITATPVGSGGEPAVWTNGQLTTIPVPRDAQLLRAHDLSESGHVVGNSTFWITLFPGVPPIGYGEIRPFVWRNGSMTRLDVGATATHVNAVGQVVLAPTTAVPALPADEGWVWHNGRLQELRFQPVDINDRGQIVGNSERGAHLWHDGRVTDLGSLGGGETQAVGINERGQVIGASKTAGGEIHAFVWTSGRMIDLGPAANDGDLRASDPPVDINDEGQVIGYDTGDPSVEYDTRAVLWQVHDPNLPEEPPDPPDPPDPSEPACATATNADHVEAGRATSWLVFVWSAGSGTYLGVTSRTTSLREAAPGRWELVETC
jgi:probable HAF family extracellular repeat protein